MKHFLLLALCSCLAYCIIAFINHSIDFFRERVLIVKEYERCGAILSFVFVTFFLLLVEVVNKYL